MTVVELLDSSPTRFSQVLVRPPLLFQTWPAIPRPFHLATVELRARIDRGKMPIDQPPNSSILKWRREAGAHARRSSAARGSGPEVPDPGRAIALELPLKRPRAANLADGDEPRAARQQQHDAFKLLNAAAFANHLRNVADFSDALEAAKRYEEDEVEEEIVRDASKDPAPSTIKLAQSKLDVVGCLIERRIWASEMANDEVSTINAYSDSSPVTGSEVQGMLCDIFKKDNTIRRVTLPGATLSYGQCDAISKMIAFLWAAWLCFGPTLESMVYFVEHLTCWTTDFGQEVKAVETPDCLRAFIFWINGASLEAVRPMVNYSRRLFYKALRMGGWSHGVSNIMKRVAKGCMWYPEILDPICHIYICPKPHLAGLVGHGARI